MKFLSHDAIAALVLTPAGVAFVLSSLDETVRGVVSFSLLVGVILLVAGRDALLRVRKQDLVSEVRRLMAKEFVRKAGRDGED